jgi:hypothetical protein
MAYKTSKGPAVGSGRPLGIIVRGTSINTRGSTQKIANARGLIPSPRDRRIADDWRAKR